MADSEVPESLRPWISWVLKGQEELQCPFFQDSQKRQCAWPSSLKLDLHQQGVSFQQQWRIFSETLVPLPGDQRYWPQEITHLQKALLIQEINGHPFIRLAPGSYLLQGQLYWHSFPDSLTIPLNTGLIELTKNQVPVPYPTLEKDGKLWFHPRKITSSNTPSALENQVVLRVHRYLEDDIPLKVTTQLNLEVSGIPREITLKPGIIKDTLPLNLVSPFPTRQEDDGSLRIQARPGHWEIQINARHLGPAKHLYVIHKDPALPEEETWVVEAHNELRLISYSGGEPVDSRQTTLPTSWHHLPAFQVPASKGLELIEKKRGNPDPAPNQLTLHREFWFDFDGRGVTVRDKIQGQMTQGWRLEIPQSMTIGRVSIDGNDQLITQLSTSQQKGVEVRSGNLNLIAESRLEQKVSRLPAVSWNQDFQKVSAQLHFPPGWRIWDASGMDQIQTTWLKQWTLLDLFVVFIISFSVVRIWGKRGGALALSTLVLIYHEPVSPSWIFLNILIAVGLLQVLPPGRIRKIISSYKLLSLLALLLVSIPFMIQQVRNGLYPQLEKPWQQINVEAPQSNLYQAAQRTDGMGQPSSRAEEKLMQERESALDYQLKNNRFKREAEASPYKAPASPTVDKLLQHDPNAIIQTGPGVPLWTWEQVFINWNGPVASTQEISLLLTSPRVNLFLSFLRVLLLASLILCVLDIRITKEKKIQFPDSNSPLWGLVLLLLIGLSPTPTQADFPSSSLLDELRTRLIKPPECLPECASIAKLKLMLSEEMLMGRMEIHAADNVAIPLPGMASNWLPQTVLLDGKEAEGLMRTAEGQLSLYVPKGIHQVIFKGVIPSQTKVQLALPLIPHWTEIEAPDWEVEGLHTDGKADRELELKRRLKIPIPAEMQVFKLQAFPPFLQIQRTLLLGLTWTLETRVQRVSPTGSSVLLEYPLMPGEAVTSPSIQVKQNQVQIKLGPDEQVLTWNSVIEPQSTLQLKAADSSVWTEIWKIHTSPIWHVEAEGIPVIQHQSPQGHWIPEWRPWPGEQVLLTLNKPQGISGQNMTLDYSLLKVTPGTRATENQLKFTLRSSQGAQRRIQLPANSQLQSIHINGKAQPIRIELGNLTLPIVPGKQEIEMVWRENTEFPFIFRTPLVDLGVQTVNAALQIQMPQDRWTLFVGGPQLGPAVLIWGVLLVILLLAFALGRIHLTPLKTRHWILLAIGLTPISVEISLVVAVWLIALGWRQKLAKETSVFSFNMVQLGLGILTFFALTSMLYVIQQGLLGHPEMQIQGNGSTGSVLRWYQDRTDEFLPQAWVVSVPLPLYRISMLLWALWLSSSLLKWLRWGWDCYSTNGLLKRKTKNIPDNLSVRQKPKPPTEEVLQEDSEKASSNDSVGPQNEN
ncbi:hypothetical protein WDW89_19640 [Deltaproteobacteria bacterium TL4]